MVGHIHLNFSGDMGIPFSENLPQHNNLEHCTKLNNLYKFRRYDTSPVDVIHGTLHSIGFVAISWERTLYTLHC